MTVSGKGLILVAVPLVFQLAFVLTVIRFQRDYADAQHWANHTKLERVTMMASHSPEAIFAVGDVRRSWVKSSLLAIGV